MTVPSAVISWQGAVKSTLNLLNYQNLDHRLVLAIIWKESTGNPWAYRPENAYRWLWDIKKDAPIRELTPAEIVNAAPPGDFAFYAGSAAQEWACQRSSWGLMQIMGATAREQGFRGNYLTELCDPWVNIEYGLKHLWNYAFQKGNRSTVDALQRYNGGGNKDYAGDVIGKRTVIEVNAPQ